MKEFIEKLIERLEELKEIEKNRADSCDEDSCGDGEQIFDDGRSQGRFEQTHKIIKIINQLAEEYNNDFCKWEKYEDKHIYYNNCKWRNEDIDEYTVSQFKFCPYCGKKIKVVE